MKVELKPIIDALKHDANQLGTPRPEAASKLSPISKRRLRKSTTGSRPVQKADTISRKSGNSPSLQGSLVIRATPIFCEAASE